ncbi:hypothetical protein [Streptomyces sp. NPDC003554]
MLDEKQRIPWAFTPFERVGPLEFGMTHEQAEAAVDGVLEVGTWVSSSGNSPESAEFWSVQLLNAPFFGPAVTVYYDRSIGLSGIAVNALRGPHVTLDGLALVGQVPSRVEDLFIGYLETHKMELRYSQNEDPYSEQLGLVLRAQRAGDLVLSRPVMVAEAWAERCGDTTEGFIPHEEWKTFEW